MELRTCYETTGFKAASCITDWQERIGTQLKQPHYVTARSTVYAKFCKFVQYKQFVLDVLYIFFSFPLCCLGAKMGVPALGEGEYNERYFH